jgi:hypothetical protein
MISLALDGLDGPLARRLGQVLDQRAVLSKIRLVSEIRLVIAEHVIGTSMLWCWWLCVG